MATVKASETQEKGKKKRRKRKMRYVWKRQLPRLAGDFYLKKQAQHLKKQSQPVSPKLKVTTNTNTNTNTNSNSNTNAITSNLKQSDSLLMQVTEDCVPLCDSVFFEAPWLQCLHSNGFILQSECGAKQNTRLMCVRNHSNKAKLAAKSHTNLMELRTAMKFEDDLAVRVFPRLIISLHSFVFGKFDWKCRVTDPWFACALESEKIAQRENQTRSNLRNNMGTVFAVFDRSVIRRFRVSCHSVFECTNVIVWKCMHSLNLILTANTIQRVYSLMTAKVPREFAECMNAYNRQMIQTNQISKITPNTISQTLDTPEHKSKKTKFDTANKLQSVTRTGNELHTAFLLRRRQKKTNNEDGDGNKGNLDLGFDFKKKKKKK